MKQVVLEVENRKFRFLIELLRNLPFVKIVQPTITESHEEWHEVDERNEAYKTSHKALSTDWDRDEDQHWDLY